MPLNTIIPEGKACFQGISREKNPLHWLRTPLEKRSCQFFDIPLFSGKTAISLWEKAVLPWKLDFSTPAILQNADKKIMREKTFLEILTEKITKAIEARQAELTLDPAPQGVQSQEAPLWMNRIPLRKIEFRTPKSQVLGRIYPLNTPKRRPASPRPSREKHTLTERQQLALAYFLYWQVGLGEDYTYEELKRAFRSLALKLHPDRNQGTATYYMEMKKHYESLKEVFSKPSS